MSVLYIILILIMIFLVWITSKNRKIKNKSSESNPKSNSKSKSNPKSISSDTRMIGPNSCLNKKENNNTKKHVIMGDYPKIVNLYLLDESDTQLLNIWSGIAQKIDPNYYDLRTVIGKEGLDLWNVIRSPSIRVYESDRGQTSQNYIEYDGNFDSSSIQEYITSQ